MLRPIHKLLVCNRGEIAIRIFRSCTELGIRTVALYSHEDRFSLHRYKADEAYRVGDQGAPVTSYLDIDEVIRVAKEAGVDAIHPGYGFLSERVDLREAAEAAGINFVGPSSETLEVAGDKVQTRALAERVGVPTIPGSGNLANAEEAAAFAERCGYPVMLKAAFGGGGRGMRKVDQASELAAAFNEATAESESAFGRAEIFLEKYITRPKHIEVQLLGDGTGEVVHLYERDCSLQRRHQKIIEVAPAVSLQDEKREELFDYGLRLAKELRLLAAATAEFLISEDGSVFFIEINPRIQVEHTVTEEVTGVDLVQSQIKIASGQSLVDLDLVQERIPLIGVAIQCRITTEDPANDFQPDYGRLVAYRSGGGFGIRLDAGSVFAGNEISPFYDSMLVKVTARGRNMIEAAGRLSRCLREFRIRGVKTNVAFLDNLLHHGEFLSGKCRTTFLEEHPEVFKLRRKRDRANRLLRFLGDVTVNGHEQFPGIKRPDDIALAPIPKVQVAEPPFRHPAPNGRTEPYGWRDRFIELGVKDFLTEVRSEQRLLITDTTIRDAHQSLLATRMRTDDMLKVANILSHNAPGLFSLEMWGGATFDVCLRFLREDPWERLALLREAVPNILFQMLLRGANGVGYKSYPDNVIKRFVRETKDAGMDIFRIFDSLNNLDRMKGAIAATKESGGIAEVCVCYTGDVDSEERKRAAGEQSKFDLEYYRNLVCDFEQEGADIIAIKDMAGLCRPYAAQMLVKELREVTDLPIHFHTHDTAGVQSASYVKAAEAGVDIVDCAMSAMSGVTSQPSLEGLVATLEGSERDTGLDYQALTPFSSYWEVVRRYYAPFESDLKTATSEVYTNEIPGGQYSNLRPQAASLGLGDRWAQLKASYAAVNQMLGGIVKVTPSSKVVGDFAIFMVANNLSAEDVLERAGELDFPASVVEFFQGELGQPYGGFPKELQAAILRNKEAFTESVDERLEPADFVEAKEIASKALGKPATIRDALSYLLYPAVFEQYAAARKEFSNLILLPTPAYFYGLEEGEEISVDLEPGKRLFISLEAVSEPGENGERTVFFELNGQPRNIQVRDSLIAPDIVENEKCEDGNPNHIGASLAGAIVGVGVEAGQGIEADHPLFTLEAMKMQTIVQSAAAGTVKRVLLKVGDRVSVGDLVVELE